jgi:hypothetical protein
MQSDVRDPLIFHHSNASDAWTQQANVLNVGGKRAKPSKWHSYNPKKHTQNVMASVYKQARRGSRLIYSSIVN